MQTAKNSSRRRIAMHLGVSTPQKCQLTVRLFLLTAIVLCLVVGSVSAQQPGSRDDFKSFDELMGEPARPNTTPRSRAPALPIPDSTWPPGAKSDFETIPVPRFNESPAIPSNNDAPSNFDYRDFQYRDRNDSNSFSPYDSRIKNNLDPRIDQLPAVQPDPTEGTFSWNRKRVSVADLSFATSTIFVHNTATMERKEEAAYLDLISATERQWRRLLQESVRDRTLKRNPRAEWEEAFYRFPEDRRLAWGNGKLIIDNAPPTINGFRDPFAPASATPLATNSSPGKYLVLDDIAKFPQHFIGRPIVLYGRFTADYDVKLVPPPQSAKTDADRYRDSRTAAAIYGQTDPGLTSGNADLNNDTALPSVPKTEHLLRGRLIDLTTSNQIAMVDTKGLLTPSSGLSGINDAWRTQAEIPVLVKGWVVKNWKDNHPLIYCESLRLIAPRPHVDLVRANTVDKRRLRDEETWLYYETLKQLELTSNRLQADIADAALQQRIDRLMGDIIDTSKADLVKLSDALTNGSVSEEVHSRRRAALQRRLDQRLTRYKECRKSPEEFQTYVDMYQHPEAWHGDLVTLRGHVRHVVSYPGDEILFGGKELHELWLFTDDSQHNPAVIVTPNLPKDFPLNAEVIDYVTVTGCFFKRYVYGSQDTDRIAPLILASQVTWRPTVDQVQDMVAAGLVSAGSPRAARAAAIADDKTSETAMLLTAFVGLMILMVLWGRAQREERDRVHLRKLVNDVPVFENSTVDRYASLLTDIPGDSASEYLSSTRLPTDKYRP
jgi:hypothetical protein